MEPKIIKEAEFTPRLRTYILLMVAFFMLISIVGIPIMIIWLLGFGQVVAKIYYNNLSCQLTERHLEFKKGALFKKEKTIPLENIQDLTFIQNPLLSLLNLRILKVETAGQSNPQGSSDMKLIGIIDSPAFKELVLEQRTKMIKEDKGMVINNDGSSPEQIELLTEIRDLLKQSLEAKL